MHIPEDVARLVFEASDVDGCVALGQTCRSLRNAFIELDELIGRKVRECAPWMEKGDFWRNSAVLCASRNKAVNAKGGAQAPAFSFNFGEKTSTFDKDTSSSPKWQRITSDKFLGDSYAAEAMVSAETHVNPSREQLQKYNGVFSAVDLPLYSMPAATVADGNIGVYMDKDKVLDLKNLTVLNKENNIRAPEVVQLLDFGSESRDYFTTPSGIKVQSDTPADTGNRYPEGMIFYEDIKLIGENESVMIVAKRCFASTRHEAFYVYKPDAEIVDNSFKFNFNDWKMSAMDPLMPPQLVGNSPYIAVEKKIGGDKWICLEHASQKDNDLILLMKREGELNNQMSLLVYNGLIYIFNGYRLCPVWVNMLEKRKLMFNYLIPEEKDKYTVCEVKPSFTSKWTAPGPWIRTRSVPSFARAKDGRYVTMSIAKKGGGYIVADLETGKTYHAAVGFTKRGCSMERKPDLVFPSIEDERVVFYSISRGTGRTLLKMVEGADPKGKKSFQKLSLDLQKQYDTLRVRPPVPDPSDYSDSEEDSDNEPTRQAILRRPQLTPAEVHAINEEESSDEEWFVGPPPFHMNPFAFRF